MTEKGRKERIYAIIIGLVMVTSMVGFAMPMMIFSQPQTQATEIPDVVHVPLSMEEKLFVLRSGKTLIEHFHEKGCPGCRERNALLETFASTMTGYLVLNQVVANESLFQMTSPTGEIVDLEPNITEEGLMEIFCDVSYIKPKPCLLMEI